MTKRRGKSVSFDAMVKFFMQHYNIPTKKDIENLMSKLDRIETLIKTNARAGETRKSTRRKSSKNKISGDKSATASDRVLEVIKKHKQGARFADIQEATGFGEKKLRNIIFRLNQIKKIKRKSRGVYIAS